MGGGLSASKISVAIWDPQFFHNNDKFDDLVLSLGKQPEFAQAFGPVKKDIEKKNGAAVGAGVAAVFTAGATVTTAVAKGLQCKAIKLQWVAYCINAGIKKGLFVAPKLGSVSPDKIMSPADIKKIPEGQLKKICKKLRNEDKMVAQWCVMQALCLLKDAKIVSIVGAIVGAGPPNGEELLTNMVLAMPEVPEIFETINGIVGEVQSITDKIDGIKNIKDASASSQDLRRAYIAMVMEKRKQRAII